MFKRKKEIYLTENQRMQIKKRNFRKKMRICFQKYHRKKNNFIIKD